MRSLVPRPAPTRLSKTLLASLAAGLLVAAAVSSRRAPEPPAGGADAKADASQAREAYGRIPLSFEANQGQVEGPADFLARGAGYALFLNPTEAVFALRVHEGDAARDPQLKVLRMRLEGADNSARAEGADELEGKANYLIGNDPSRWRTGVPTFGSVHYRGVYPGVDLVYYGNQRQLEYDFRVGPGADPRLVSLRFEGADSVELNADGDLLLALGGSVVRQPKPFVYQEIAGARREVEGGYELGADGRVRFSLGEYDPALPLVIDPVIVYSTYLGGSGTDLARAIAVDPSGNAVITGYTQSLNFPTANAFQGAFNGTEGFFGNRDVFVTKINAAGDAYVYSTYLGGTGPEEARGIAVDSSGNAYVAGFTSSDNFPITANAVQKTMGGTQDAFVTKLNPTGSTLVYSTFLGGAGGFDGSNSSEFGEAIAVDSSGNAYVTGSTFSNNFPLVNAIQDTFKGGSTDAFVTKINAEGDAFVYSTYLGGNGDAAISGIGGESGRGIAADSAGNTYVTGETNSSTDFPLANAVRGTYGGGGTDAFVAKIDAAGDALIYSTYLGGGAQDSGEGVKADASGNTYVAGFTVSNNFPVANAFQGTFGGVQDAFVTKLIPDGSALVYSTYFGGTGGEIAFGLAIDASGSVHLAGSTGSFSTLPTANAIQCTRNTGTDLFITKFNAAGLALVYSTYLGGSDSDSGEGIALDSSNNAYVTGATASTDFPTVIPIQSANGGGPFGDAFVTKISDTTTGPASQLVFTQTAPSVQEDVTSLTLTVQRTGDTSGAVTVDYATANGTASERSDYTTAVGTLRFAAGETAKNIDILVNEDSYVEGTETFTVALSNATGGATLSCPTSVATVSINDDGTEPATNPIDDSTIFVGQHYHDFLNRQADPSGLDHWTKTIEECEADAQCREVRRINVSAAFFLSIEFQQTGYLVYRFYKETFRDSPARPRGMPRYREFLRDTQRVGRGVVVLAPGWEAQLEANKQEFAREWVQRPEFIAEFPLTMGAEAFVDKLFQNAETTPTADERAAAIAAYGAGGTEGRAAALRNVADSGSVYNRQFNSGFILSQYIGYLRRNPNDAPEPNLDYAGFDHWLTKLNGFSQPGDDVRDPNVAFVRISRSEMIKAFLASIEYRQRFGQ